MQIEPHGELECIEFFDTLTIYDPENLDAWITVSWDYDALAKKHEREYK